MPDSPRPTRRSISRWRSVEFYSSQTLEEFRLLLEVAVEEIPAEHRDSVRVGPDKYSLELVWCEPEPEAEYEKRLRAWVGRRSAQEKRERALLATLRARYPDGGES